MPDKWGPTLQPGTRQENSPPVNTVLKPCYGLPPPPNPSSALRESAMTCLTKDAAYISAFNLAMQKLTSSPHNSDTIDAPPSSSSSKQPNAPTQISTSIKDRPSVNHPPPPSNQAPRFLLVKRDQIGPTPPTSNAPPPPAAQGNSKAPAPQPATRQQDKVKPKVIESPPTQTPDLSPEDLQRDFKRGFLFRGKLRINASETSEAYVTIEGLNVDVFIMGAKSRGRCLEGDEVAVRLHPTHDWFVPGRNQSQKLPKDLVGTPWATTTTTTTTDSSSPCSRNEAIDLLQAVATRVKELIGARPTGKAVAVLEPSPRREQVVGILSYAPTLPLSPQASPKDQVQDQVQGEGEGEALYFLPMDPRLPPCLVTPLSTKLQPDELLAEARAASLHPLDLGLKRTLMSGRVVGWPQGSECPLVELRASLGQAGEIESETAAILEQEGVRREDFSPEVLACLPSLPWLVKEEDLGPVGPVGPVETWGQCDQGEVRRKRRDFRGERVFSIDPPTAKDLDDALHVERISKGRFKIGVHIADVASFIPPYSALDIEAGQRSTSVYLVQRVIPMLPPLLCEELCSLNPGVDRFAFSVVWEVEMEEEDEDGPVVIKDRWAGRSVIRSCGKLTYPIVQTMIEGSFDPKRHDKATRDRVEGSSVDQEEEGKYYNVHSDGSISPHGIVDVGVSNPAKVVEVHGGYSWASVMDDSLLLWKVAKRLRKARFDSGALRLDNVRLSFKLDKDGNPTSCSHYNQREANQLVEEFMLLANLSVAEIISDAFPSLAMLRRHAEPDLKKLQDLIQVSEEHKLGIDISSSASLQSSLAALRVTHPDPHIVETITMMATRPMQLAAYFCTGDVAEREGWRHYALAIGAYTHFTSPIRRYPDVVVHRLLAAALDANSNSNPSTPDEVMAKHQLFSTRLCVQVSDHCNEKRLGSRKAQDASLRLYLCCLLRRKPVVTTGVLLQVGGDRYFNVYCPEFGIDCRIHTKEGFGVDVRVAWTSDTKTILVDKPDPNQIQRGGGGKNSRDRNRKGFEGFNSRSKGGGRGQGDCGGEVKTTEAGEVSSPQALDPCSPLFDYQAWINSIGHKLDNPGHLDPAGLPLRLRALGKVPVVLCSVLRPGKVSEVTARIYLGAPSLDQEVSRDGPAAIKTERDKEFSSVPFDSITND